MSRRVVITGIGLICPLGNSADALWEALSAGRSGVHELKSIPGEAFPSPFGAEARDFTGAIEDFGPLEKTLARTIKKGLKVMCREMQMGIAASQLALTNSKLPLASTNLDRVGCIYGSDYMLSVPQDLEGAIRNSFSADGKFEFNNWGDKGLSAIEPLWLLKYLPNLPASHISIFNNLHGPNNSLTMREASSNLAVAEATATILRGHADAMLAGATGGKIHPTRTIHAFNQEEIAVGNGDPAKLIRPFDKARCGMVLGEGAAAILLEELASAQARGATIWGEVIGFASSAASDKRGTSQLKTSFRNVIQGALASAGIKPADIGHIHAHGLGTRRCDAEEAQAIAEVFASRPNPVPVVAAKSYFGNLGAAGGLVELVASLLCLRANRLFRTLNYETPDPECPVKVVAQDGTPPGDIFLNLSISPQGQSSAVVVHRFGNS